MRDFQCVRVVVYGSSGVWEMHGMGAGACGRCGDWESTCKRVKVLAGRGRGVALRRGCCVGRLRCG